MIKIEAASLEHAYAKAAEHFECSVTELEVEIIQRPKNGFLSFFKKSAIIVASSKRVVVKNTETSHKTTAEKRQETPTASDMPPAEPVVAKTGEERSKQPLKLKENDPSVDNFFEAQLPSSLIVEEVSNELNALFDTLCFRINPIQVTLYDETTLLIEFSGEDAALLIGKEGYRYKALSYMIYNWINTKYHMQLRLEIAEFLKNQEEAIGRYLEGVCENIDRDGRAQTKVLDGVLVQIALKELRTRYPDKYVAIRSTRDGAKFIIINDYNEY